MSREAYSSDVIKVALTAAEGFPFERFAQELHAQLVGADFVPTGGQRDGGADGVLAGLFENKVRPTSFFQASIRQDVDTKIRQTISRLREVGRSVKTLEYWTSKSVSRFDLVESGLSDELDVTIRVRDASYISVHVNHSAATRLAFQQHLSHYAAYLRTVGSSRLIPTSAHVKSPAVYTYLAQEVDRRKGDTSALHAMVDALILWSLEGTDPDKGIFMTRDDVLAKVLSEIPSVDSLVRDEIGPRLQELAGKGTRLVRWHRKEGLFCLPFDTRLVIENENASDVILRDSVLDGLRERISRIDAELPHADCDLGAAVALRALQITFERQGLEFAAFLSNSSAVGESPDVASSVAEALTLNEVAGKSAIRLGPAVFQAIREVFYNSTGVERLYLRRLSSTYALLFILNTEPRLIEFFQDMAGDFYLYVGTDQLLKALSEHFLEEPDQMATNALRIAGSLGATLVLTQPVLEEVVGHFRAADFEFRNHIVASEPYLTFDLARNVGPIMIRSYLYARLNSALVNKPTSWEAFVQQFCSYDELHKGSGESEFLHYLLKKFSMEYVESDELEDLVDVDDVEELARELSPHKSRPELARNDALLAHAVYGNRKAMKEVSSANEFGFNTWWLTGETSILRYTNKLVESNRRSRYIMRPEFLLNFVALAPSAESSRKSFANIFPTLLGIRLAKRMDESAFHSLMERVDKATQLDEHRRSAAIAGIVDSLKGNFSRDYMTDHARGFTNSIDIAAARSNDPDGSG